MRVRHLLGGSLTKRQGGAPKEAGREVSAARPQWKCEGPSTCQCGSKTGREANQPAVAACLPDRGPHPSCGSMRNAQSADSTVDGRSPEAPALSAMMRPTERLDFKQCRTAHEKASVCGLCHRSLVSGGEQQSEGRMGSLKIEKPLGGRACDRPWCHVLLAWKPSLTSLLKASCIEPISPQ